MSIKDKFLKYVSFDTQSEFGSQTHPSTLKQRKLGEYLVNELISLGLKNAYLDDFGYVYASLASNNDSNVKIGLVAHMDTATEVTGFNVNPQIIEKYDGQEITLLNGTKMSPTDYPSLKKSLGNTLVTTDGTTLLGADDKAGIAIIMQLLDELKNDPNFKHPNIFIAFTPDEEIGEGADHFNYDFFKVDFAYTLDGGPINNINYENFNAASAVVNVNGFNIHPGSAKDKMINSISIAMEFDRLLPVNQRPEYTENYEGFNHLNDIKGDVCHTKLNYIIRNHDSQKFEAQKELFRNIARFLNEKYPSKPIELTITDSYQNMSALVMKKPESLELPVKALLACGLQPTFLPIRGGTDGARLTYEGVICPNLGTGSANHHGILEYADLNEMQKMVNVLKNLLLKSLEK